MSEVTLSMLNAREAGVAEGLHPPEQMPIFPPAREFFTSAGFGGAAALLAALIVALIALLALRAASKRHRIGLEQQERHHQQQRASELHEAAVTRCWQRLVWVVETAGIEPASSEGATLGLGPELALELLQGLQRDAEQLADETLAQAATVYLNQFSLVLAQQGGPLSALAALPVSAAAQPNGHTPPTVDTPAAKGRRRHR